MLDLPLLRPQGRVSFSSPRWIFATVWPPLTYKLLKCSTKTNLTVLNKSFRSIVNSTDLKELVYMTLVLNHFLELCLVLSPDPSILAPLNLFWRLPDFMTSYETESNNKVLQLMDTHIFICPVLSGSNTLRAECTEGSGETNTSENSIHLGTKQT